MLLKAKTIVGIKCNSCKSDVLVTKEIDYRAMDREEFRARIHREIKYMFKWYYLKQHILDSNDDMFKCLGYEQLFAETALQQKPTISGNFSCCIPIMSNYNAWVKSTYNQIKNKEPSNRLKYIDLVLDALINVQGTIYMMDSAFEVLMKIKTEYETRILEFRKTEHTYYEPPISNVTSSKKKGKDKKNDNNMFALNVPSRDAVDKEYDIQLTDIKYQKNITQLKFTYKNKKIDKVYGITADNIKSNEVENNSLLQELDFAWLTEKLESDKKPLFTSYWTNKWKTSKDNKDIIFKIGTEQHKRILSYCNLFRMDEQELIVEVRYRLNGLDQIVYEGKNHNKKVVPLE
jgi:hypothetical protein